MFKDILNVGCGVGESTMNRTQVILWYNRFKEGRQDFNDDARPGRPSVSTTDVVLLNRLLILIFIEKLYSWVRDQTKLSKRIKCVPKNSLFDMDFEAGGVIISYFFDNDIVQAITISLEYYIHTYEV